MANENPIRVQTVLHVCSTQLNMNRVYQHSALLAAMEYMEDHLADWLGEELAGYGDEDYLVLDCPGERPGHGNAASTEQLLHICMHACMLQCNPTKRWHCVPRTCIHNPPTHPSRTYRPDRAVQPRQLLQVTR